MRFITTAQPAIRRVAIKTAADAQATDLGPMVWELHGHDLSLRAIAAERNEHCP